MLSDIPFIERRKDQDPAVKSMDNATLPKNANQQALITDNVVKKLVR